MSDDCNRVDEEPHDLEWGYIFPTWTMTPYTTIATYTSIHEHGESRRLPKILIVHDRDLGDDVFIYAFMLMHMCVCVWGNVMKFTNYSYYFILARPMRDVAVLIHHAIKDIVQPLPPNEATKKNYTPLIVENYPNLFKPFMKLISDYESAPRWIYWAID
jgi:hypothetical protein